MPNDPTSRFERALRDRILVLDGAMGSMIQTYRPDEAAYRGKLFANHSVPLKNFTDLLVLTQPGIIEEIHGAYLDAGADIIETDTFNATSISAADYAMQSRVYDINVEAARLARRVADRYTDRRPDKPRFVAGSMGPTTRVASMSNDVNNPAHRDVSFDDFKTAYYEQARGLLDGGVDVLLTETVTDTLNLKAALFAIQQLFDDIGRRVPVMASVTIIDKSGRTLSGQTLEAFWNSIAHIPLVSVGINCALGADHMRPFVEELSRIANVRTTCYPNAGLPNDMGGFDEVPDHTAGALGDFARNGWVNMVGGCCGTTPAHIQAIARTVEHVAPREIPTVVDHTRLAGLEPYTIRPETNFTLIGERTNITGSKRFRRMVLDGQYEAAVAVARDQVLGGANVLDVNMDEGLVDGPAAMTRFLNQIASEPDVARIPVMLDSSRFEVLEAGLKCLQGKGVVNSISLKEGEESFLAHARLIRRYGAAVVVMCFDETGQATTVDHKVAIAERAYKLLTERVGFAPSDVIIDPNILTVGTGIEEHAGYAVNFVEATRIIKQRLPGVKISGGLSNVSFAFRGNDYVREAVHAAFLYRAIEAGLDMAIVNAGQLAVYDDVPKDLLALVEDVLWNRRADATERLVEYTGSHRHDEKVAEAAQAWRALPVKDRVAHALVHGIDAHIDEDMAAALKEYPTALSIIEGPLMDGMNIVGDLFGDGRMFLPQVVKSARVMKKAVRFLEDYMPLGTQASTKGTVLMATVKGDVHDIGKNIVGVVLACNSYKVVDLGVMVTSDRILAAAREVNADIVGVSGLITPSLDEMTHVAKEMQREGFMVPLLIGGATTSAKHTAIKIAPGYEQMVVHVKDASRAVGVVSRLLSKDQRPGFDRDNRAEQQRLRERHAQRRESPLVPWAIARTRGASLTFDAHTVSTPGFLGVREVNAVDLGTLVPYIDWAPFFHAWEFRGTYPAVLDDPRYGDKARELHQDAQRLLGKVVEGKKLTANAVYGFFAAARDGDDVVLYTDDTRIHELARLPMLRQQEPRGDGIPLRSLADYVSPVGSVADYIGMFAVTAGLDMGPLLADFASDHDDYHAIMARALADRLAEALTEHLHARMRVEWGFGEDLTVSDLLGERYRGIRPAPGYPACPDHNLKTTLFRVLDATARTGIELTESLAMTPPASVSGLVFGHPSAGYFSVGSIGRDQVSDYARRIGMPVGQTERWLAPNLGYDPE